MRSAPARRALGLRAAAAALVLAGGCTSGSTANPLAAALTAEPPAFAPGATVELVPTFDHGAGRIEPDVGPVVSGGRYRVGPAIEGRAYRLVVEDGGARVEAAVKIPFAYRDRVRALAPPLLARARHAAVGLADGRVLLAGGSANLGTFTWTAEIYDPAAETSAPTGELRLGLAGAPALRLPDGRVLLAGGASNFRDSEDLLAIWSPQDGAWTEPGALATPRSGHALAPLPGGEVLVTGGDWLGNPPGSAVTEELLAPETGATRAPTGSPMVQPRAYHTATPLTDGRVLIAGGWNSFSGGIAVESELFDPAPEAFAYSGSLAVPRGGHAAVRLADGRVLVTGGIDESWAFVAAAELWDPATGVFSPAGTLATARVDHTATLLADGRVLVAGGEDADGKRLDTVELWDPRTCAFTTAASRLGVAGMQLSATVLPDGRVLLVGGEDGGGALRRAEVFE